VSKADYPYADDEFDAPTGPDVPRGVHRAPRSAWSRWWPFVVVIVVVPAIAYALVTWASRDNSTSDDANAPATSTSASSTPKASETATAEEPSVEPTDEASPSDEPTTEEPTAEVELGTPVTVYNAAGIEGLAASTVDDLEAAGFTSAKADNFSGTEPGTSTIYYASEDLEPTAALVGQTIGVDALELSESDAGDGISVVLISDPTP
jgi:cytoskeletal protein RodZ